MVALAIMNVVQLAMHEPGALDGSNFRLLSDPFCTLDGCTRLAKSISQCQAILIKRECRRTKIFAFHAIDEARFTEQIMEMPNFIQRFGKSRVCKAREIGGDYREVITQSLTSQLLPRLFRIALRRSWQNAPKLASRSSQRSPRFPILPRRKHGSVVSARRPAASSTSRRALAETAAVARATFGRLWSPSLPVVS